MFETLTERFAAIFSKVRGKGRLSETDVDSALREVRLALLEADVNVSVVKDLLARIRERAVGAEIRASLTPGQHVVKIVHEELVRTLGGQPVGLAAPSRPPLIVLMVGLQGSGKTTSAAKLALRLKQEHQRTLLVAADLQRPAAVEQLERLAEQAGVGVHVAPGNDPARVVKAAVKRARTGGFDSVVVDTAGRLQIDDELMAELTELKRIADPDEVLLVVDAMTGQDAVNVAEGFLERTDLTGIVLSKLDGDARGGAAISVREVTGRPIKFAGVGERLEDFEVFHPDRIASRILGMGDVLTLIEKAEEAFDASEADQVAEKIRKASFTLEDFLQQFQQVRKMGSMAQLLAMLPGAGAANLQVSDRDVRRVEAIIRSMTPDERQNPKIVKGSRRRRIAAGSGTTLQEVNNLLKQFAQAQKMMKSLAEGHGIPSIPGLSAPGRRR
jgi:signal recognition particle subunit SRP54